MQKRNYRIVCEYEEEYGIIETETIILEGKTWQGVGAFINWLLTDGEFKNAKVEILSDEEFATYKEKYEQSKL